MIQILSRYQTHAPVMIQVFDWNPKKQIQIATVIDANNAKTPTNPLIVLFAGPPPTFDSYDNTGYNFPVITGLSA